MEIKCLLSGLSQSYKYTIKFHEPQTLYEAFQKTTYSNDRNRNKPKLHKNMERKEEGEV